MFAVVCCYCCRFRVCCWACRDPRSRSRLSLSVVLSSERFHRRSTGEECFRKIKTFTRKRKRYQTDCHDGTNRSPSSPFRLCGGWCGATAEGSKCLVLYYPGISFFLQTSLLYLFYPIMESCKGGTVVTIGKKRCIRNWEKKRTGINCTHLRASPESSSHARMTSSSLAGCG